MLCGGLILKKILCFIVLLFSLAVPAFADDVEPLVISPDSKWDSSVFWSGLADKSYPALPTKSTTYHWVVWKNPDGDLYCAVGSSRFYVFTDRNGNLSIECISSSGGSFYRLIDGSWIQVSGLTFVLGYSDGLCSTLMDTNLDIDFYNSSGYSVFFSLPTGIAPTPTPTPIPPKPLAEVVQQMQGEQIQVSLIPSLTGSLGVLAPFGIGLLASLAALAVLPKVLRKFLA